MSRMRWQDLATPHAGRSFLSSHAEFDPESQKSAQCIQGALDSGLLTACTNVSVPNEEIARKSRGIQKITQETMGCICKFCILLHSNSTLDTTEKARGSEHRYIQSQIHTQVLINPNRMVITKMHRKYKKIRPPYLQPTVICTKGKRGRDTDDISNNYISKHNLHRHTGH